MGFIAVLLLDGASATGRPLCPRNTGRLTAGRCDYLYQGMSESRLGGGRERNSEAKHAGRR
jgi:hypothetical protein